MARRRNGLVDDLLEITARLPWWLGVVLALLAYLVLHPIATKEFVMTVVPGQMGAAITTQLWKTLAQLGQYVLPFIFLLGAGMSFLGRIKREKLLTQTQQRGKQSALLDMSWREFEMLVGEAFRQQGYAVDEIGGNGPDGGIDLVLKKGRETYLVQCKQWKALKVGVTVVRELYGVMAAQGAVGGFVVTSGQFTADAVAFAQGRNIELIGGEKLLAMIQKVNKAERYTHVAAASQKTSAEPLCPVCGTGMVARVAKQGSNAGKSFWGCKQFPRCKGVIAK